MREGFYVSVRHGQRSGLLLGPFGTKEGAERFVATGRRLAREVNADAHWYSYGTARVQPGEGRELPQGSLNSRFTVSAR